MNKAAIHLSIAMLLGSVLFLSACDSDTSMEESKAETSRVQEMTSTPPPTGDVKFAYVNTDSLSTQFQMIKDLEEELLGQQMTMENQLQTMIRDLENDYRDAQEGAAGLSQEALAILQQKLGQKEQAIQMQRQQMEGELMRQEQEKTSLYLDAVHEFLEQYAKDNGYQIIYGYNGLNNLLYIDKGYDITQQVVSELNATYADEQASLESE